MTLTRIADRLQEMADDLQKTIDTPVPNVYELAMRQFPASPTNNAREIVKSKLERMSKNPNDRTAKELDDFGFSVDWDDRTDHIDEIEQNNGTEE